MGVSCMILPPSTARALMPVELAVDKTSEYVLLEICRVYAGDRNSRDARTEVADNP